MTNQPASLGVLESHAVRVWWSHTRARQSDVVASEAWRRIARSYQRIARPGWIRGGSEDGSRESIRARLLDGTLPRVDGRAWVGKGDGGHECACCGQAIDRSDHDYEPQAYPHLHAHARCFTIWLAESAGLRNDSRAAS